MTIIFEGPPPYELITQKLPTATSEGEIVVLTLPVFAAGFPQATADIQVRLELEHAEQLAAQLQPAVKMATVRRRSQS
jgi:hypothetical protein